MPVAQLDRAFAYEAKGRRFESSQARSGTDLVSAKKARKVWLINTKNTCKSR